MRNTRDMKSLKGCWPAIVSLKVWYKLRRTLLRLLLGIPSTTLTYYIIVCDQVTVTRERPSALHCAFAQDRRQAVLQAEHGSPMSAELDSKSSLAVAAMPVEEMHATSPASLEWPWSGPARQRWGVWGMIVLGGVLAALAGFPAIVVPAGFSKSTDRAPLGVPVGIEFMARPWEEPKLLKFAYGFEQAAHARREPKSVAD